MNEMLAPVWPPEARFGTHLPVLKALDPKPTRVLEFGSGYNSTAAFLEMPSVVRLVSVEIYPDWREKMVEEFGDQKRWTLLSEADEVPPFEQFDLILIDDGTNDTERLATIERVLSQRHPKVVIHDAEYHLYAQAIDRLADDYQVYRELMPWTAIVAKTP